MMIYTFFSVHEQLLTGVCKKLRDEHGATAFSGFVWGKQQARYISGQGISLTPLCIFSKDLLSAARAEKPVDSEYLAQCERIYKVSLNRIIFSERHLLKGRTFQGSLRLLELVFRMVENAYEQAKPSLVLSTDVACLVSYVHYVVAKGRGIPFTVLGDARLPTKHVMIYHNEFQLWERTDRLFVELRSRDLTAAERAQATEFVESFRENKARPPGLERVMRLPTLDKRDFDVFMDAVRNYREDPDNPTVFTMRQVVMNRLRRLYRNKAARAAKVFEPIDASERYILFPLHFQPEASTLVLAPYYLDQITLIEDIAKSLPVGYRLYVKEHGSSMGRRPKSYYDRIRAIYGVRLLAPEENTWDLIKGAAALAVITGTMGWEALLFERPVISFGKVFYNSCPLVYRAGSIPREGWYDLFRKVIFEHQPDRELLLKFVSAILQTCYSGYMRSASTVPEVLDDQNLTRLAAAIAGGSGVFGSKAVPA